MNSWQSFKNRCYAAQKKQQQFINILSAKERNINRSDIDRHRSMQPGAADVDQQIILKNALLNSTMRFNANNNSDIDIVSTIE